MQLEQSKCKLLKYIHDRNFNAHYITRLNHILQSSPLPSQFGILKDQLLQAIKHQQVIRTQIILQRKHRLYKRPKQNQYSSVTDSVAEQSRIQDLFFQQEMVIYNLQQNIVSTKNIKNCLLLELSQTQNQIECLDKSIQISLRQFRQRSNRISLLRIKIQRNRGKRSKQVKLNKRKKDNWSEKQNQSSLKSMLKKIIN